MSENTQNNTPKKEQYSLNDDRRVKVLSPGALVAKRFFRNRLAVVGLTMLLAMFVFSFIGGVVSPYGQDQQFYTYTQMCRQRHSVQPQERHYAQYRAVCLQPRSWPKLAQQHRRFRLHQCGFRWLHRCRLVWP